MVNVPAHATSVAFPIQLSSGASYNVGITSQPQRFTDICTLSNASGTIANSNITNIAVLCHPAVAVVSTLAGGNGEGNINGTGSTASFHFPTGIAVDSAGNAYVADQSNHLIRKITSAGVVSTLAGNGGPGRADGVGTAASFNFPRNVALDTANNVYVADSGNNLIRKITPSGLVSTLAGNGTQGKTDGVGTSASFFYPEGLTVDTAGNVYVADTMNQLIRKISPTGTVTTLAGGARFPANDGSGGDARLYGPAGIAADNTGNLYVADGDVIRKITTAGVVSTLAGSPGRSGSVVNGTGPVAVFYTPTSVAVDGVGNVFVADFNNNSIRMVTPSGVVTAIAGNGSTNGGGNAAGFYYASGVAVDSSGIIYVALAGNNAIVKISPQ